MRGAKIKIRSAKEGVESYVTLSAHGEVEGGIPRLLNDFQEMVKKVFSNKWEFPMWKK